MVDILIIWTVIMTIAVIVLALGHERNYRKIEKLENFLKDDMEQEEIMNGKS